MEGRGQQHGCAAARRRARPPRRRDCAVAEAAPPPARLAAPARADYCPEALIIGGGECQPSSNTAGGCNIAATGPSGIWQIDSARGGDKNLFSPCDNAAAAYDQMVRAPDSFDLGCYSGAGASITPSLYITGAPPGGGVGGSDGQFFNTSGTATGNCDWLGPFCHWQTNKNKTPDSCCAWTGGANSNQPQGFPYVKSLRSRGGDGIDRRRPRARRLNGCSLVRPPRYYYMFQFLTYNNVKNVPACPGACDELAQQAIAKAKSYCDAA